MRIAELKVYSLLEARESPFHELAPYRDRTLWIGFVPEGPSPFKGKPNSLVIECLDVVSGIPEGPTLEKAQQIVDFIRQDRGKGQWAVAVHCTAGVSRSGALATWVQETFHPLLEGQWRGLVMHIHPNPVLLKLLRQAGMK